MANLVASSLFQSLVTLVLHKKNTNDFFSWIESYQCYFTGIHSEDSQQREQDASSFSKSCTRAHAMRKPELTRPRVREWKAPTWAFTFQSPCACLWLIGCYGIQSSEGRKIKSLFGLDELRDSEISTGDIVIDRKIKERQCLEYCFSRTVKIKYRTSWKYVVIVIWKWKAETSITYQNPHAWIDKHKSESESGGFILL